MFFFESSVIFRFLPPSDDSERIPVSVANIPFLSFYIFREYPVRAKQTHFQAKKWKGVK